MANKYMKKHSMSLAIKEMQIKRKLRVHLTPIKMAIINTITNVGKDMGQKNPYPLLVGM
jgi:hypothetical protein